MAVPTGPGVGGSQDRCEGRSWWTQWLTLLFLHRSGLSQKDGGVWEGEWKRVC